MSAPRPRSPGSPEPLGLTLAEGGANVAVYSETAENIELCLFDASGAHGNRRAASCRDAPARSSMVLSRASARARFTAFAPTARGARTRACASTRTKLLLDPYALALDGPLRLHESLFALAGADSAPFAPKAVAIAPSRPRLARRQDSVARTRSSTNCMCAASPEALAQPARRALRGTFAGLAHPAALAHLKSLGVTTLELMPCAAWIDERHLRAAGLTNYWGYNPVALLRARSAPRARRLEEVRESVAALQAAGFEVLIDVVLNHTGESDAQGPTLSLRGLDNATYYRLDPENPRPLSSTTPAAAISCGSIIPRRCAYAWTRCAPGRSTAASTVSASISRPRSARRAEGFDPHAPLLAAIAQDPLLRDLKLIAEPWDIGPGGYQIGRFPAALGRVERQVPRHGAQILARRCAA